MKERFQTPRRLITGLAIAGVLSGCNALKPSDIPTEIPMPQITVDQLLENPNKYIDEEVKVEGVMSFEGQSEGNPCQKEIGYKISTNNKSDNKFVQGVQVYSATKDFSGKCTFANGNINIWDGSVIIDAFIRQSPNTSSFYPGGINLFIQGVNKGNSTPLI